MKINVGHFLTRDDAARRAHIPPEELSHRPDLLRIGGRWLEEVYFAFQFDERGIRRDIGNVVRSLRGEFDDIEIADWLARPNPDLGEATPLQWCQRKHHRDRLRYAASHCGPVHDRARRSRWRPRTRSGPPPASDAAAGRGRSSR